MNGGRSRRDRGAARALEATMGRTLALLLAALALVAGGCRQRDALWFDGDFAAATTLAKQSDAAVMLVFETEWCIWCDRLERETLADPGVRGALAGVLALKLDAEGDGEQLAARYGVDSYPTIVFVNGNGEESDRIPGYLPPGDFIAESQRILGNGAAAASRLDPSAGVDGATDQKRVDVGHSSSAAR
jgi:thioredoxin-related protein